jgi:hypothetical protein
MRIAAVVVRLRAKMRRTTSSFSLALLQGLTLAHFKAQLEDLRDTSLTLELNVSTFGPHPRLIWVIRGTR